MQLHDRLIERLYDASVMDDAWSDVVPAIADHCGARSAVILINDQVTGELAFADEFGVGTEYRSAYLQDLRQDDLRLDDLVQHPVGTVRTDTMIPRYDAYRRSRAYLELYSKLGTEHALGAFIFSDGRRSHGLRLFRSREDGAFGNNEISRYEELLPHLARVFRIRSLHHRERSLTTDLARVLDLMPWGICLLSSRGDLAAKNARAEELLSSPGHRLPEKLRRKTIECLAAWRANGLRRHAAVLQGGATANEAGGERLHLRLEVVPAQSAWAENPEPFVLAVIAAPVPNSARHAEGLAAIYNLTRREQAVASHLLAGRRLTETAEALDIAFETTRSHLRNIFAKTGVSRQVDLMRLGLSTPAVGSGGGPRRPDDPLLS